MKEKIIKNIKVILITISLLIFLLILIDIFKYEVTKYDDWAYNVFVLDLRNDNLTIIMKIITSLASVLVLGSIILLVFLLSKNKKNSFYMLINLFIVFILNNILKVIVQRPRPSGYNIIEENFYSFPSGHSMVSVAFYGFLIYLVYNNINNKILKYLLIFILFMTIILICISRIYLGVHYLSDVVAGFAFSIAYLMIFITIIEKYNLLEVKNV